MPTIAVVTLDGFNEVDSFVASYMIGRVNLPNWTAAIACPTPQVTSMNGVTVHAQMSFDQLPAADAVIVGSGARTRDHAADPVLLAGLRLDPARQLIGSQCSGALLLKKLGLLEGMPVCTDLVTKPWVIDTGADVVDAPFHAEGNIATAGGCLAGQYLAAWIIGRLAGLDAARDALFSIAPVGEKDDYVQRALGHVRPCMRDDATKGVSGSRW